MCLSLFLNDVAFQVLFCSCINSLSSCMNDKERMEIKEDKVKQEIMKDFKSMRHAKQDRIKGYTTGTL